MLLDQSQIHWKININNSISDYVVLYGGNNNATDFKNRKKNCALIVVKRDMRRIDTRKRMVYENMLKNNGRRTTLVP